MAQPLPLPEPTADNGLPNVRGVVPRGSDPGMRASNEMLAMEQQLRNYEEELTRLRVENEQLRRSSQAFGELAERLSVALQTATRVNLRTSTAADHSGHLRVLAES
jgi:hypothetical protein